MEKEKRWYQPVGSTAVLMTTLGVLSIALMLTVGVVNLTTGMFFGGTLWTVVWLGLAIYGVAALAFALWRDRQLHQAKTSPPGADRHR